MLWLNLMVNAGNRVEQARIKNQFELIHNASKNIKRI